MFALDDLIGFVDGAPGISELLGIRGAIGGSARGDRWLLADHFVFFRLSDGFRHALIHCFGAGLEHLKRFAMPPRTDIQDLRLQIDPVFVPRDALHDCTFNAISHMEPVANLNRQCRQGDKRKSYDAR